MPQPFAVDTSTRRCSARCRAVPGDGDPVTPGQLPDAVSPLDRDALAEQVGTAIPRAPFGAAVGGRWPARRTARASRCPRAALVGSSRDLESLGERIRVVRRGARPISTRSRCRVGRRSAPRDSAAISASTQATIHATASSARTRCLAAGHRTSMTAQVGAHLRWMRQTGGVNVLLRTSAQWSRPALTDAVDLARTAWSNCRKGESATTWASPAEDACAATHRFAATFPGYRGWQWAVVVAADPEADHATVSELALLPGPDALVAPEWMPWDQRIRPGDLGPRAICWHRRPVTPASSPAMSRRVTPRSTRSLSNSAWAASR